ncbi:uncharacterized protein VICG_01304 [Vittaforma corneae ATCC 50505]|uniref:Uncharacterized protein n=1 Tax=Vittaforma corneae (strain ATCC 50505) TaxID=993615 RepID=L2GLF0_VITCO|nr:uncharacterized protein VICG_01304 [Vittaforma corneae ATCC 50505]ELA41671.1 hypothetical protein VICG_01304 [Vittaforma corneae ATCC 50505]
MSSIWKTKLKRVRKHALSAATSFILYMLFYRIVLISLTIFRLKCSNFYIENLKYNSAKDSSCLISFKSDAFSPLYIDFYSSTASVCIETPRGIYSVCELSFGHIELNKFGNIEFNSTVALNHIDFSKIPAFLNSNRKITLELSMVVSLRFLLIPLTFVVNKKLFKIDQMLLDNNANSGFKDKNMVIDQFFKSLNVQPDRRSRENLEKCDLLKSFDIKNVQFEGRCYNRVVLSFMPLHGAKLIKDVDLHFENFHLNFTMPIPLRVIVKDVSMSSAGYRLDVLVPDIGSPNIIVKILQIYWEKKLIHIEVDRVWHRKSSVANQKTSSEQDVLVYQKSNERNLVSLTIPFSEGKLHLFNGNWKVRDFHILPGQNLLEMHH